jgi:hypothetical protein
VREGLSGRLGAQRCPGRPPSVHAMLGIPKIPGRRARCSSGPGPGGGYAGTRPPGLHVFHDGRDDQSAVHRYRQRWRAVFTAALAHRLLARSTAVRKASTWRQIGDPEGTPRAA